MVPVKGTAPDGGPLSTPHMNVAHFGSIDGTGVYGACRPGHFGADLDEWTAILDDGGIDTVVCLLSESEAARWRLPDRYAEVFDTHHLPIRDRHLPDPEPLRATLDRIEDATADGDGVVMHCNAGLGRVGVVGSAWLVRDRGLSPEVAVETIETEPPRRSPRQAVEADNATMADLYDLLDRV